ncbi:MAG TPA: flagellar hook capping FlgD N-terminal domain-containing protein [Alphaproteobacteria bacterium]|nr:flagellar hook capping FlgD N-terminal domain-containing protein [Alphaproteobacteria bacterium]
MDIAGLAGAAGQQATANRAELSSNFDMFLRLLTTQLQNQDPLEPTDTNQFTQQLVQYSQVEQQIKSNEQLASLVSLQGNLQLQSALTYIGMDIRVADNRFNYAGSGDYNFDYALPQNSTSTKISILNEAGDVVYTADGSTEGGKLQTFNWDGKTTDGDVAPAGKYTIEIAAQDENGKTMTVETAIWGKVTGMETTVDGTIILDMNGIPALLGDVLAARQHQQQAL